MTDARMPGRVAPAWCPHCRATPGPDCPTVGRTARLICEETTPMQQHPDPDDPVSVLLAAAELLEKNAATAPRGPYTADPTPGYHRQILGPDGDPIAATRQWPGGIGDDTGSADQTAAHLKVWTPEVARTVAVWLRDAAARLARTRVKTGLGLVRPDGAHEPALATARALLAAKDQT